MKDKSLQVFGSNAYGCFYSVNGQQVNSGEPITFDLEQLNYNVEAGKSRQNIYVRVDGLYRIVLHIIPNGASQWTLFLNGTPQYDRIFGTFNSAGQLTISYLIPLKADDCLTFRNYISESTSVSIPQIVGGNDLGANCEVVIDKVAPYPKEYKECPCEYDNKQYKNDKCESDSSDKSNKKEHKLKRKFNIIKKWMKCDPQLMLTNIDTYGSFYSTVSQNVTIDAPVLFYTNQNVSNLSHTLGSGDVVIQKAGVYLFVFVVETAQACQFTVFINGVPEQTTTAGINKGANTLQLRQIIELKVGDIVTIRNHTSANGTVVISQNAGGVLTGVNTQLILERIALSTNLQESIKYEPDCELEKDCRYKLFKEFLLEDKCLDIRGAESYYFLNSATLQTLNLEDAVSFTFPGPLKKVNFIPGKETITILESGIYKVNFDLQSKQPAQFTIFLNNVAIPSGIAGTDSGSGQVSIRQLLELKKHDVLSVKNHSSFLNPVITSMNAGGWNAGINAIFCGLRLGPIPQPQKKPCKK